MTAKEYLLEIKRLDRVIAERRMQAEEISYIRAQDTTREKVDTSPRGDALEKLAIKELSIDVNSAIDDYMTVKNVIIGQIERLGNAVYQNILYDVYVHGMRLEEVAVKENYSHGYVKNMHIVALKAFQSRYKREIQAYCDLM